MLRARRGPPEITEIVIPKTIYAVGIPEYVSTALFGLAGSATPAVFGAWAPLACAPYCQYVYDPPL